MKYKITITLLSLIFTFSKSSYAQIDSIRIIRICHDLQLGQESITLTNNGNFYFLDERDKVLQINLNKYSEFKLFLQTKVSESIINSIVKVQDSLDNYTIWGHYEEDTSFSCFLYSFNFYSGSVTREYKVYERKFWHRYSLNYKVVEKVFDFIRNLYRDKGCPQESYFIHIVKPQENLYSIAKFYGVGVKYLVKYNLNHRLSAYYSYYDKNVRRFDIKKIYNGEEKLWKGDRLVIPCFCSEKK